MVPLKIRNLAPIKLLDLMEISLWKTKMYIYIMGLDDELWDVNT